jgi:hypothetical protein
MSLEVQGDNNLTNLATGSSIPLVPALCCVSIAFSDTLSRRSRRAQANALVTFGGLRVYRD